MDSEGAFHVISTHAKCFDGAAAASVLERYCAHRRLEYTTVPHVWGKSYIREFGLYFQQKSRVVILMFDVSPDEELVDAVYRSPHVRLVCGDHHVGTKPYMDSLVAMKHDRIQVRFDNRISGAQLAWEWVSLQLSGEGLEDLGIVLDGPRGNASRLLHAICEADLWRHKGDVVLDHVDASLRMLHTPDAPTVDRLLSSPGSFDALLRDGPVCARIRDVISRDLLQRGRTFKLHPTAVAMIRANGSHVPDVCTVFYAQGIPHLSSEMAFLHTTADMVWIWSKNESSPAKRYTVAVRRGKVSELKCHIVARTLGGGNGHAEAAGMAFDTEPLQFLSIL